jgi:hypothetical protein
MHPLGHAEPDRELHVQAAGVAQRPDVGQPLLGGAGAVGADQDRGARAGGRRGSAPPPGPARRCDRRRCTAPALPGRSSPARASLALSSHTEMGWKPNPPLKCGAADSLSEWHLTTVASTSSTGPGQSRPPAVQAGRGRSRPASARSSQARSRACARASRTRASAASSTASSIATRSRSTRPDQTRSAGPAAPARSLIASPPSASIRARSGSTRPGS